MKYEAYPKYKKSGVEWLDGDGSAGSPRGVPEHWDVKPLKHICRFAYGDSLAAEDREDGDVGVYGSNGQVGTHIIANTKGAVIVIGRKGSFGKINFSNKPVFAIDTTYFVDQRYTRNNIDWLKYALLPLRLDEYSKDSAVPGLAREDAYENKLSLPPLPEQQAIAAFLDRETGRIDILIGKKQKFVDLLKEKRTALISQAVTKGLNPKVKMKPSGVEWLGDVPEHWGVKKLRYICNIQTGDKDTIDAVDDANFPFYVRSQTIERIDSFTFDCEAVLTAGDGVGVGKVFHYVNGKFDFHQRVYMFNNFKNISGMFFFYFLRENFWKVAFDGGAKSTVDSLRRPMITNFTMTIPPPPEQQAIVAYLDSETGKIAALIGKVETAIEKLKEYRTALISAAVTGKIDVREAV